MISTFAVDQDQLVVRETVKKAVSRARHLTRPALLSVTDHLTFTPDPIAFLGASTSVLGGGAYWEQPESGIAFSGAGLALKIRAVGPGRFGQVSGAIRDLQQRLVCGGGNAPFPSIGGFAFSDSTERSRFWSDFSDGMFTIPEVLLQIDGQAAIIRITIEVAPGTPPSRIETRVNDLLQRSRGWASSTVPTLPDQTSLSRQSFPERKAWESSVATAVAMINQGMIDKVVLAREERLLAARPFSPVATLARLRRVDASATLFALQAGGSWFIGATPERLVRLENGLVDVTCLAGSIGIGVGASQQQQLAQQLLASKKDREEHEIVVRSTMSALADVCDDVVRLPGTPRVVPARSVQHLETPLRAWLSNAGTVLDLVERLHPTPAVGGSPQGCALAIIRELEQIDRGWYAGPFGWVDLNDSGEFAVAIRSALLSGTAASLFAGSGIVAASVPEDEYEETCLKLRPMLSALGAG